MSDSPQQLIERLPALLDQQDQSGLRNALVVLLERDDTAQWLRALDDARLLTRVIPELEPARATDQPIVHFLPVLAHSLEAVTAVDWLFSELERENRTNGSDQRVGESTVETQPVAVRLFAELQFRSRYAPQLRDHFVQDLGAGRRRRALFKLATLLHDVAKPETKQPKVGGGVSFYQHQTIGGEVALAITRRLGFAGAETAYIRTVVREHMRPGQLGDLDEVTLRAVRRFFQATGVAGPDVLLHSLADHMATRGPNLNVAAWLAQVRWNDSLLDTVWGTGEEAEPPLVTGNDLIEALALNPGPQIGFLLSTIEASRANGAITTRAEALELARSLVQLRHNEA